MLSSLFTLLALCSLAQTAPTPDAALKIRQDPDSLPGYANIAYSGTFEDVANATELATYQGATWSGFQTITLRDGIIPHNCPYFGPDRNTRCHYAYAARSRVKKAANAPTISAATPATLIKLKGFSWAVGPQAYFGRGGNLTVTGYFAKKNGNLVNSGVTTAFFYAAAQNVGGSGAGMGEVTLPANFGVFNAYKFNITSDYAADEPYLLLDDVSLVAYTST